MKKWIEDRKRRKFEKINQLIYHCQANHLQFVDIALVSFSNTDKVAVRYQKKMVRQYMDISSKYTVDSLYF